MACFAAASGDDADPFRHPLSIRSIPPTLILENWRPTAWKFGRHRWSAFEGNGQYGRRASDGKR
jgi:hypothetical protein